MQQTKIESMLEVFANYASGFIIAMLVYKYAIIPNESIKDDPFIVTSIFTAVSIARSYIWRRFFNNGVHVIVHQAVSGVFKNG